MKLSDKPKWVEITERDTDEIFIFCHRCKRGRTFEGNTTIESGIKYANEVHGRCENEEGENERIF